MGEVMADGALLRSRAADLSAQLHAMADRKMDLEGKKERLNQAQVDLFAVQSATEPMQTKQRDPYQGKQWKGERRKMLDQSIGSRVFEPMAAYAKVLGNLQSHIVDRLADLDRQMKGLDDVAAELQKQLGDIQDSIRNLAKGLSI